MRLTSFADVLSQLDALEAERPKMSGSWDLARVLTHCAQSIEYSMSGYPKLKPALFRATVGRIAKNRFISKGEMSHSLTAEIAGAPVTEQGGDVGSAVARLRKAIAAFAAYGGTLAPHLAYGACTHAEYEQLHAMHIADHLREVSP